ncbi:hypothetical protein WHI96_25295 [Pseudonocardia tropica]|uniref:Uncharacterized protein n=1 Tax=Pseudonocardia tropica TaxID=681289 RepID=A0ABV1K1P4_9PSEU
MRSGVRYGALWAGRRDGGWRDTSLVAALAAPVVLPPTLLAAAAWLVYAVVEALAGLAGKGVNP